MKKLKMIIKGTEHRRAIMEKVSNGEYGFNSDYIIHDYKVERAGVSNYLYSVWDATLNFCEWQLSVVEREKDTHIYSWKLLDEVLLNIREQIDILKNFIYDWRVAESEDELECID